MIPEDLNSILTKFNSAGWSTETTIIDRSSGGSSQAKIRFTKLGIDRLKMLSQAVSELEGDTQLTATEFAALLLYAKKVDEFGGGSAGTNTNK